MKKIFFLLASSITIISCNKVKDGEFLITGTAKGIENGKSVILEKQDPTTGALLPIDSAKVENGKFEMKGKVTEPEFHLLQVKGLQAPVPLILETGEITVAVDKDSIQKSKISGTYNNDEYVKFNEEIMKIQKKLVDFQKKNSTVMNNAQKTNDTTVVNRLMREFMKMQADVQKESKIKYTTYAESHPKAFISALIIQGMLNDPSMDLKKVESMYASLDESVKKTKPGKEIKEKIAQMKAPAAPTIGSANWKSDFSAPDTNGKMVSLKESLGKVTIIDFWASWCGPCREENPNVVAIYKELHSKGLNIIGVSLDKDAGKWKEAIAKDNLTWTQVSNLKFWDEPIAVQYGVKSIPATFILDASGKIVAQDLRGSELKAKITELLAK